MRSTTIYIVIILIVLAGLGWWWFAKIPTPAPAATALNSQATASDQGMTDNGVTPSASQSITVTYDGKNFSPASVAIPVGGTVNWVDTSGTMWVASNPHPVHDGYDGTTKTEHCAAGYAGPAPFDQCAASASFTFTFSKAGTWGYHDHFNHDAAGTVVVQ